MNQPELAHLVNQAGGGCAFYNVFGLYTYSGCGLYRFMFWAFIISFGSQVAKPLAILIWVWPSFGLTIA